MNKNCSFIFMIVLLALCSCTSDSNSIVLTSFPEVVETSASHYFPLSDADAAGIYYDEKDYKVVDITATFLADDVERVTGKRPSITTVASLAELPAQASVVAGTIGSSALIDELVQVGSIDTTALSGKWESYLVLTTQNPHHNAPLLVIVGSDRRGTAFGLTSLSKAIGVSPWYWWADVTPMHKEALFVQPGRFLQKEPSVQYRGIFINDERFGGWARWVEQTYDTETHQVGPKVYKQVFELLLRLGGNYLWPAMHNGSRAFNANPENARLADDYAIVMGTSHCEQMLRNNEDEWKNVGTYGDFNFITNRQTMLDYWEERVKTNGAYENTYTLGLRGIHDYPMEGANTSAERVKLMQQALDCQREMLARNIDRPLNKIPQVLIPYEEVLEAYHDGLQVPDDVILLWSDDKQGYTRNLCNPDEMKRSGGSGIYYHLSYHGDPASWIWLSPLSPAFVSTELTKAYTYGARKIWVFNVGDIKPAEKEICFVMELAWDIDRWTPEKAHGFIAEWAARTFGAEFAPEIAEIMAGYYQLMASGKDSHVWFLNYSMNQIRDRISRWQTLADRALALESKIPASLQAAYFELILYPVRGAQMINEYQLLARTSMVLANQGQSELALADAARSLEMHQALDAWTKRYNEELLDGKWREFFNWKPYHWFRSPVVDAPMANADIIQQVAASASPRALDVQQALSADGVSIEAEVDCDIPLWINALTSIRNFSKAPVDNQFCRVSIGKQSFDASATPINNVWHAPYVGPMWSQVGTIHLQKGSNCLRITGLKDDARIDDIYMGLYPPFSDDPLLSCKAGDYKRVRCDKNICDVKTVSGLGYNDGVVVLPFDVPSYESIDNAPCVEYEFDFPASAKTLEVHTLANLHVYEGLGARYAVQVDDNEPQVFDIHADDFSAEWRWNVLRGYTVRSVNVDGTASLHKVRIYLLDPGIVLQDLALYSQK